MRYPRPAAWGLALVALAAAWAFPPAAPAQEPGPPGGEVALALGPTYYCIVTRCNSGLIVRGAAGYSLAPAVLLEAGLRWHDCFDCDRFVVGEAGARFRLVGRRLEPYLGVGAGVSSDPEFMGTAWGFHASAGSSFGVRGPWALLVELRGRQVGRGDYMGELTAGVSRRVPVLTGGAP